MRALAPAISTLGRWWWLPPFDSCCWSAADSLHPTHHRGPIPPQRPVGEGEDGPGLAHSHDTNQPKRRERAQQGHGVPVSKVLNDLARGALGASVLLLGVRIMLRRFIVLLRWRCTGNSTLYCTKHAPPLRRCRSCAASDVIPRDITMCWHPFQKEHECTVCTFSFFLAP